MKLQRAAALLCILIFSTGVTACSSFGNGPQSSNSLVIAAAPPQGSRNAITDMVGGSEPGVSVAIIDPLTGSQANLRILGRYDSAAGNSCADYEIMPKDSPKRTGVVCNISGAWQEVRPLLVQSSAVVSMP